MQRLLKFFVAISAGLVLAAITASAQPANNNYTNALVITNASGTLTGTNFGATLEPGEAAAEANCGNFGGASVWFSWTAPSSGPVTFNTEGSDFDTSLG